jgi:hypothetical protein
MMDQLLGVIGDLFSLMGRQPSIWIPGSILWIRVTIMLGYSALNRDIYGAYVRVAYSGVELGTAALTVVISASVLFTGRLANSLGRNDSAAVAPEAAFFFVLIVFGVLLLSSIFCYRIARGIGRKRFAIVTKGAALAALFEDALRAKMLRSVASDRFYSSGDRPHLPALLATLASVAFGLVAVAIAVRILLGLRGGA